MKKQIKKLGLARFNVTTINIANSQLILDFNPIISKFNLKGNFTLIHWQARPKGYREWGIYSSDTDSYISVPGFEIQGLFKSLQIKDQDAVSIPSAVLYLQHD